MRKNKHWVFLILLSAIILSSRGFAVAQDTGDASSALCEYGIKLYKEGQIADAIHELKKALIVNPHNLKAKNYLMKIYSEKGLPFESLADSAKKIKIREYENQINKLETDAHYYQKMIDALNKQNATKEAELEKLGRELQAQKEHREKIAGLENQINRLQKETTEYQKQLANLNAQYLAKEKELEKLHRELQAQKDHQAKIAGLENQIRRLEKETGNYQKQLAALNTQYLAKEAELKRLDLKFNSQKELMDKNEQKLLQAQKKKHLANLASKKKELVKLKADYEKRLKLMEANLRAKENLMLDECQSTGIEENWLSDNTKNEIPKLECELDENFLSAGTLEFAEKQGVSSWEKLNQELRVLMPSLEGNFDIEDTLYNDDNKLDFQELKMEMNKDSSGQTMLSDLDK